MINIQNLSLILILLAFTFRIGFASDGDSTTHFLSCKETCEKTNCTENKQDFKSHVIDFYNQTIFDRLLAWSCLDECKYSCMWKTVDGFLYRGWKIPQFYGKWPFVRFLGLQEPASVIFSLMNLFAHVYKLRQFRHNVRNDSPCYGLWHVFALCCINGWLWSSVFHARDFPVTELLDYTAAYSMVLVLFYCMVIRMVHDKSIILKGIISAIVFSFYINYFAYLSVGKFSYSFNMNVNILTGSLTGLGWLMWCVLVRKKRPYYKKIMIFYILFGLSMVLEILDFPPIFWIIDAHSLWHLSSLPIVLVLYGFITVDCNALRKEKLLKYGKLNREI